MREVIIGDKDQYKILEDGSFYSKVINKGRGGSILGPEWIKKKLHFGKCDYTGNGYYSIAMSFEGKTTHRIHRLVARFFVEGYKEGLAVDHIDGNRANNNASNLRWVTHKQNITSARHRGAFNKSFFNGKISKDNAVKIIQYINDGKTNKEISQIFNICASNISKIRHKNGGAYKDLHCLVENPRGNMNQGSRILQERALTMITLLNAGINPTNIQNSYGFSRKKIYEFKSPKGRFMKEYFWLYEK